jgi:hypothetical protein
MEDFFKIGLGDPQDARFDWVAKCFGGSAHDAFSLLAICNSRRTPSPWVPSRGPERTLHPGKLRLESGDAEEAPIKA